MNCILIPGRNRPELFHLTMESLAGNPEVGDYCLLFALENDVDGRYFDIIRNFTEGLNVEIMRWREMRGLTAGVLEGLKAAFSRSDEYVVLLEDDVVVSRDFLRFLDYCHRHFCGTGGSIATVGGSHRVLGRVDRVYRHRFYLPWGVLLPRGFFDGFLREHCNGSYYQNTKQYADRYYPKGYCGEYAEMIKRIMLRNDLYQIQPEVPRSLHIGFYGVGKPCGVDGYGSMPLEGKIAFVKERLARMGLWSILNSDCSWSGLKLLPEINEDRVLEWDPAIDEPVESTMRV